MVKSNKWKGMPMQFKDFQNIHQMIKETVDGRPNDPAYRWFLEAGVLEMISWEDFYNNLKDAAKSLIALGIEKDDKINILSYSCYQWLLSDFSIASIGACTVGIYQTLLPKDCQYIINHSDAVLIFAEDETQLNKLYGIREKIPNIRKVILYTGQPPVDNWVMSFENFLNLGKDIPDEKFEKRVSAVNPSDPAAIVYTSGTTGVPKGAVLTHDNLTFTAQSVFKSVEMRAGDDGFLFLPLAHVFARTCVYTALYAGVPLTFTRSMETIVEDIKVAKPLWFPSVPRVYEKVYAKVVSGAEAKGGLALKIFHWACDVGNRVSDYKLNKQPIPFLTNLQYNLATKLVFSKIKEALGGRLRWCISGAAPLNASIGKFFHAAGILILEGVGMTENTSFTNLNRYDNYRFGWVGLPGPGIEQKLAEDGEILYRGRNVMKEYYKMPEETAQTITKDGWQHTGDLGEIDPENFLRITGRKKEIIITAGGKNIAPSPIEGTIATSKYIGQVCLVGDARRYLTALITLDRDTIQDYAKENNIGYSDFEELMENGKILSLIKREVDEKNNEFASFETVKKFTIVPEFTIENGLLTPTLKIKKNLAMEKYKNEIEAMYNEE
jgi:long-chain acyl-CoA synthetase